MYELQSTAFPMGVRVNMATCKQVQKLGKRVRAFS